MKLTQILNAKGFSLTEVMVGGGILAGVALAGAQMFNEQKTAQKKITDEQKLTTFHQGLQKQMGLSSNCNATFKAANLANGTAIANDLALPALYACGSECDDTNRTNGGGANKLDRKAIDVNVGNVILNTDPSTYIDAERVWQAESIIHKNKSGAAKTTTGPMVLRVTYKKDPRLTKGRDVKVIKDLNINTRFSGGQFQECLNANESSINNLQKDMCNALSGGFTTTGSAPATAYARWDDASQTCIVNNKDCSAQGLVLDGVDSLGNAKCKSVVSPYDSNIMQQNDLTTCPSGTPNLKFENGKFKVVCS